MLTSDTEVGDEDTHFMKLNQWLKITVLTLMFVYLNSQKSQQQQQNSRFEACV